MSRNSPLDSVFSCRWAYTCFSTKDFHGKSSSVPGFIDAEVAFFLPSPWTFEDLNLRKSCFFSTELASRLRRLFFCSFCTYSSQNRHNVVRHERSHTGIAALISFMAEHGVPGAFLSSPHNQSRLYAAVHLWHLLIPGEKPFRCKICERGFGDSSNLRQHERTCQARKDKVS